MDIAIVGLGRLGRSLIPPLERAGHRVVQIGRDTPIPTTAVVWLTVPDLAIAQVAAQVPAAAIVLHASGATGLDVFGDRPRAGSLHPLMTFPGPELSTPDLTGVPAAIAGDPPALEAARAIARSLGMDPFIVPGDRRLYHAAAVLAGNGATILLAEASRVLAAAGVDPDRCTALLRPLALRSLEAAGTDPARALTGPIARGEQAVIDEQVSALRAAGLDDLASLHAELARLAAALRPDRHTDPTE